MQAKPFTPGQVLGGYRIDALDFMGETIDETRYRCTAICCGTEAVRTHVVLFDARKKGHKTCKPCADKAYQAARRAKSRRQVGEICGHYEILAHVGDAYRVRTTCCQTELLKNHRQVQEAAAKDITCCAPCKRAGFVRQEEEIIVPVRLDNRQVWCLETQGLISAATAWPRPRSLAA